MNPTMAFPRRRKGGHLNKNIREWDNLDASALKISRRPLIVT